MATVNVTQTVQINLGISEDEARWLQGYLQNNMSGGEETRSDAQFREALFMALYEATKHLPRRN